MARPESEFPTIEDARDVLQQLIDKGFGKLPMQVVIVPPSTLVALARDAGHTGSKPAIMIEMTARDGADMGVLIASVENMSTLGGGSVQ